jgi:hypothetical protein
MVLARLAVMTTYVAALVLGGLAGVVGSFLQAVTVAFGPLELPIGLVLALALSVGIFIWAGLATGSRIGAAVAFLSWLVAVVFMSMKRSEGDLVLTAQLIPLAWIFGGMVLGTVCVYVRYPRSRGESALSARDAEGPAPAVAGRRLPDASAHPPRGR